jgi:Domain of unknown function (DUF6265)
MPKHILRIAVAICLWQGLAFAQKTDLNSLAWISGHWQSVTPRGVVEEHWTGPSDDSMIGMSRTTREGRTANFEFLRLIVRDGEIFYVAYPNAKKEAQFKLISATPEQATFEGGDEHVQRVIYRKENDGIVGRIEGTQDGKPFSAEFHYRKMQGTQ